MLEFIGGGAASSFLFLIIFMRTKRSFNQVQGKDRAAILNLEEIVHDARRNATQLELELTKQLEEQNWLQQKQKRLSQEENDLIRQELDLVKRQLQAKDSENLNLKKTIQTSQGEAGQLQKQLVALEEQCSKYPALEEIAEEKQVLAVEYQKLLQGSVSKDEFLRLEVRLSEEHLHHTQQIKHEFEGKTKKLLALTVSLGAMREELSETSPLETSLTACDPVLLELQAEVQELLDLVRIYERWHDSMSELKTQNQAMNKLNDELNEVGIQSRVLSVNAKIEAAKSKEAKGGFSVVAQEISNLSQQIQRVCSYYGKSLDKNALLITTTFQDVQAGSRMIMTAVDGIHGVVKNLQRTFHQIPQGIAPQWKHEFPDKIQQLHEILESQPENLI